jgi:hypothetical protein
MGRSFRMRPAVLSKKYQKFETRLWHFTKVDI